MADKTSQTSQKSRNNFNLSVSPRLIIIVLLAVIAGMLAIWKPWSAPTTDGRTVEVTGDAKITDKPDEFVFYPSYQFKNVDKAAALAELTKKSDTIVAKLKEFGVASSKIETNSSGYDYPVYYGTDSKDATYSLQLTVKTGDLELAQKVQDYLVTTTPSGSVSPQPGFSDTKRKILEDKARDEAGKAARAKADQMAQNLGFKVGKVKSVSDGSGFGSIPYAGRSAIATDSVAESAPSLTVQPGENDLNYSVTVTYYIR